MNILLLHLQTCFWVFWRCGLLLPCIEGSEENIPREFKPSHPQWELLQENICCNFCHLPPNHSLSTSCRQLTKPASLNAFIIWKICHSLPKSLPILIGNEISWTCTSITTRFVQEHCYFSFSIQGYF